VKKKFITWVETGPKLAVFPISSLQKKVFAANHWYQWKAYILNQLDTKNPKWRTPNPQEIVGSVDLFRPFFLT